MVGDPFVSPHRSFAQRQAPYGILAAVTSPQLRQEQYTAYDRHPLSKVPQVTVIFWITKVLTTGMGETTSDYLAHRLGPFTAAGLGFIALVASLVVQFRVRRYRTWVYWTAVVMVAVFGTMAADGLHIELHVPYSVSTPFFAVALAVIFALWYRSEGTLCGVAASWAWRMRAVSSPTVGAEIIVPGRALKCGNAQYWRE
jgi:uncharacterized membrane-anchored protein